MPNKKSEQQKTTQLSPLLPSFAIRQKLGLIKAKLIQRTQESRKVALLGPSEIKELPLEEQKAFWNKRKIMVESLMQKMDTAIERADQAIAEWEKILSREDIDPEIRNEEAALYQQWTEKEDSCIGCREIASNVREELDDHEKEAKIALLELEEAGRIVVQKAEPLTATGNSFCEKKSQADDMDATPSHRIPEEDSPDDFILSPITLPTFDPVSDSFETFWELFEVAVDKKRQYTSIQKIMRLMAVLRGEAKRVIATIPPRAANYPVMVATLKKKYGNKTETADLLADKLMAIKPAKDICESRKLHTEVDILLNQLEALGMSVDNPGTAAIVKGKFPTWLLLKAFEQRPAEWKWTVRDVMESINDTLTRNERVHFIQKNGHSTRDRQTKSPLKDGGITSAFHTQGNAQMIHVGAREKGSRRSCIFCGGDHWNAECMNVQRVEDRIEIILKKCLCKKCFRKGHRETKCFNKTACKYCKGNHNRALCENRKLENPKESERTTMTSQALSNRTETLLMARQVTVFNPNKPNKKCSVIALFDAGSTDNYVLSELAAGLDIRNDDTHRMTVAGFKEQESTFNSARVELGIETSDKSNLYFQASTVPTLVKKIRVADIDGIDLEAINNTFQTIEVRDAKPSLLLGINFLQAISCPQLTKKLCSGHIILPTDVGPILSTYDREVSKQIKEKDKSNQSRQTSTSELCLTISKGPEISDELEKLWSLEAIGITEPTDAKGNEEALMAFQQNITRDNLRYVVGWPWKSDCPSINKNYLLALGRLKATVRRLKVNSNLFMKYNENIQEMLKLGIIEEVQEDENKEEVLVSYLPHQAVLTPEKEATKLRIVFDASASTRKGGSLNENLYRGPVLMPMLAGILLRSRLSKFIIIADVEKAFLQVGLHQRDRDVTRFLWLKNISQEVTAKNLQTYRFTRVPFGAISSPFLLAGVIHHHLKQYQLEVAGNIAKNLYVDNVLITADIEEEAIQKQNQAKRIFQEAGMNLRQFLSNSSLVNESAGEREATLYVKLLGIQWCPEKDVFKTELPRVIRMESKRSILSFTASIFDPFGYLSPVIVPWKWILQRLWKEKFGWDEEIKSPLREEINALAKTWAQERFTIPRFIPGKGGKIHVFTDASKNAYAAVAYLREENPEGSKVSLYFAKAKFAPLKETTIPKMELLGVTIGVRLIKFLRQQTEMEEATLWSDSTTVLHWINELPTATRFVNNRLQEIRSMEGVSYRYVPTKENPADLASRGCNPEELKNDKLWWDGPDWLKKPEEYWPQWNLPSVESGRKIVAKGSEDDEGRSHFASTAIIARDTEIRLLATIPSTWEKAVAITVKALQ